MPSFWTIIEICAIVVILSIVAFIIALCTKKIVAEFIGTIPTLISGALFNSNTSIDVRVHLTLLSLAVYIIVLLILHFFRFLFNLIIRKTKGASNENGITVTLPVNYPYHISKDFIENIPGDIESLIDICTAIDSLTSRFIAEFKGLITDSDREIYLKTYLNGICYNILSFFDNSVRVHVRILTKHQDGTQSYDKFLATFNAQDYRETMKSMALDNKMIKTSFEKKCSLISSINKDLCEDGSKPKWKSFMTLAVFPITYNGRPVFSFGVSSTNTRLGRMFFLNFIRIEDFINKQFTAIANNTDCHLTEFITQYYFSSS